MLRILHSNKIYPEINAGNDTDDMPRFILEVTPGPSTDASFFLNPHNAIRCAPKTCYTFYFGSFIFTTGTYLFYLIL